MRGAIVGLLGLLLLAGGWGCGRNAPVMEESREWRLQSLEKHFLEFQEEERRQAAELEERMAQWEERLAQMDATVAAIRQDTASLRTEVLALTSELQTRDQVEAGLEEERTAPAPAPEETAAAPEPSPAPTPAPKPKPQARPEPATAPAGLSLYRKGLELTRAGKTEPAREQLNAFLEEYPDSPLVPNALYWMGETYYHDKRYGQSILTFKEVTTRFPQHDKAAAALLKIGFAYKRLGDTPNTKFYLQTLLEDYPKSDPADLARDTLKTLSP